MPGLLFVHAHPDDESIWTGGTIARYSAAGVPVAVVTCTRGEEGEVIPADLAHLHGRRLAEVRSEELAGAVAALGVTNHRFLGPYEDSGMVGTPPNDKASAFWNADLDEASARLAAILDELSPDVVVTYDERGGYGHPDHIQAHRVTLLALELAPAPNAYVIASGETTPTATIDVAPYLEQKFAAMAAHRTQVVVDPERRRFHLSDGQWHEVRDTETYALIRGAADSADEADLLAGIIPV